MLAAPRRRGGALGGSWLTLMVTPQYLVYEAELPMAAPEGATHMLNSDLSVPSVPELTAWKMMEWSACISEQLARVPHSLWRHRQFCDEPPMQDTTAVVDGL